MSGIGRALRIGIGGTLVALIAAALIVNFNNPQPVDFVSLWAAAQLGGGAYDIVTHRAVEATAVQITGLLPFTHPPAFLIFIMPLGYLDYGAALIVWVGATAAAFAYANKGDFTHPSTLTTGMIGQSGFLTGAIIIGGLRLLPVRPCLAGAILGCMVIKPQLGLLLPVALIAGRQWQALGGAATSSLALLIASLALFGAEAFGDFLASVAAFSGHLDRGAWQWSEMASIYAFARYFGAGAATAIALHLVVACSAFFATWRAWRIDHPGKAPILAASSLLISPYLFGYDCILLAVPLAALWHRPGPAGVIWVLSALPGAAFFDLYEGVNTLPIAALVAIVACGSGQLRGKVAISRVSFDLQSSGRSPASRPLPPSTRPDRL